MSATQDAPPSSVSGPKLHFDDSLGALFISLIISAVLFGVTSVQSFIYYQKFPQDSRITKYAIAVLWVLDTVHLGLHLAHSIRVFGEGLHECSGYYGADLVIRLLLWPLSACFMRLWIMSNRKLIMPLGAIILSSIGVAMAVVIGVKLLLYKSIFDLTKVSWLVYMGLSEVVAADLWCIVPLCYFLSRDRTGFRTTDTRINTLIAYFINTGLLTSVISACCLITFGILPHTYVFMPFYFCLSKLYINALLAMLNARDSLSENASAKGLECNAYQLPRVINFAPPQSSSHKASFGTLTDSIDKDTQTRSETTLRGSDDKTSQAAV